jgi:hypothetical protein
VQTVEEFSKGVKEISALAKAAGRDPATIDFTVFTTPGQWRTLKDVAALEEAGAGRVTLWLEETKLDGVLHELEKLARNLGLTPPYEHAKYAFGADSVQVVSTVAQQAGTVATPTER